MWQQLWNWAVGGGLEELELPARKILDCHEQNFEEILVRAQKERRDVEKASILENIYIIMNRVLLEIWMVKDILMRSQMEMRTMLSDNGNR